MLCLLYKLLYYVNFFNPPGQPLESPFDEWEGFPYVYSPFSLMNSLGSSKIEEETSINTSTNTSINNGTDSRPSLNSGPSTNNINPPPSNNLNNSTNIQTNNTNTQTLTTQPSRVMGVSNAPPPSTSPSTSPNTNTVNQQKKKIYKTKNIRKKKEKN